MLPTIAAMALVVVFVSAGLWQWGRMEYKQALREQRQRNATLPALRLPGKLPSTDRVGRKVVVDAVLGQWLLYLDNRTHQGRPGYHVLAVARLKGRRQAVLVNLGWVPQGADRRRLPVVMVRSGRYRIRGLINPIPAVGIRLVSPDMRSDRWPKRVQYIDVEWLQKKTGLSLLPFVILADEGQPPHGFVRDWRGIADGKMHMPPERHLSYAVQWFALALTVIVVWVLMNMKRTKPEE